MSKIIAVVGTLRERSTVCTVDMRDEIITNMEQFTRAIYDFIANHTEKIGAILLSPTQEYCLKGDQVKMTYNVKEDRPYTVEEIGGLKEFMGYKVFVS